MKIATLALPPLLILLASCAIRSGPPVPQAPLAYNEGRQHGCASGFVAAGHPYYRFTKDVGRYASDGIYRQGWDDGVMRCKGEYEAIGRAMR